MNSPSFKTTLRPGYERFLEPIYRLFKGRFISLLHLWKLQTWPGSKAMCCAYTWFKSKNIMRLCRSKSVILNQLSRRHSWIYLYIPEIRTPQRSPCLSFQITLPQPGLLKREGETCPLKNKSRISRITVNEEEEKNDMTQKNLQHRSTTPELRWLSLGWA